jgi:hypothetical protein
MNSGAGGNASGSSGSAGIYGAVSSPGLKAHVNWNAVQSE